MKNINIYSYFLTHDPHIIKKICDELNEEQNLFKFTLIRWKSLDQFKEKKDMSIKSFYQDIAYPVKKHFKLSNLISITDIRIYIDENTSVSTQFSNSYKIGTIVWKKSSTIPTIKYELLNLSLQLSIQKHLIHNNEGCFFDETTNLSNVACCQECVNQLLSLGYDYKEILKLEKILEKIRYDFELIQHNEMFALIIMDIVNYSKNTDHEQKQLIEKLQEIIKSNKLTNQFIDKLIFDPTGDGCIIALRDRIIREVIKYSAELQKSIAEKGLEVRFGLNYGSIFRYRDINQNINVAGSGINLAARVMDIGDANHILVNRPLYDAIGNLDSWHKQVFHNLGFVKVKHGVRLEIFNVFSVDEGFGNSNLPKKIGELQQDER